MVRLLVVEPGYCPYAANFSDVDAAIEEVIDEQSVVLHPFGTPRIGLICSEKQKGLRFNRYVDTDGQRVYGRFLICGTSDGRLQGLSKAQADRYSRLFFQPQTGQPEEEFPLARIRPKDERYGQKLRFWER